jgi:hypothetical protein
MPKISKENCFEHVLICGHISGTGAFRTLDLSHMVLTASKGYQAAEHRQRQLGHTTCKETSLWQQARKTPLLWPGLRTRSVNRKARLSEFWDDKKG